MRKLNFLRISAIFFFFCVFATVSYSQISPKKFTPKLSGEVTAFEDGALIEGVKVVIENQKFRKEVETGESGRYEIELLPGTYDVTFTNADFRKFVRKNVQIENYTFILNVALNFKSSNIESKAGSRR